LQFAASLRPRLTTMADDLDTLLADVEIELADPLRWG
jgi:hypothetical protein